jgi:hypothetical protein
MREIHSQSCQYPCQANYFEPPAGKFAMPSTDLGCIGETAITLLAKQTFAYPKAWTASDFDSLNDISYHLSGTYIAPLDRCRAARCMDYWVN